MAMMIGEQPLGLMIDPDDGLYEIIDGNRVEKPMGIRQILLANRLAFYVNQLAFMQGLGIAIVEALFDFGPHDSPQFRPDMAFVSEERWPRGREHLTTNAWQVVPDLAVEVVSPSNSAEEIQGKVDAYLRAGVRLVWVVYLKPACVHVFDGSSTIRWVRIGEELDGGSVLPDFRLPMENLFGKEVEPE